MIPPWMTWAEIYPNDPCINSFKVEIPSLEWQATGTYCPNIHILEIKPCGHGSRIRDTGGLKAITDLIYWTLVNI